jgi:hypothetical protein
MYRTVSFQSLVTRTLILVAPLTDFSKFCVIVDGLSAAPPGHWRKRGRGWKGLRRAEDHGSKINNTTDWPRLGDARLKLPKWSSWSFSTPC